MKGLLLLAALVAGPAYGQAYNTTQGTYNASGVTVSAGGQAPLQIDSTGKLKTVTTITGGSDAVAQGSTTSGQTGTLAQCAVTTASPTYTTAQTSPLSCTTTGGLRTRAEDGSNIGLGSLADAAWTSGNGSAIAILKGIDRDTLLPLAAGTNLIGKVGIDQTTPGTTNGVSVSQFGASSVVVYAGNIDSVPTGNAGLYTVSELLGYNGSTLDRLRMDATAGLWVTPKPMTTGGLTTGRVVTGTSGTIKASAGQAYSVVWQNTNAAVRYLQFYNKASAPTLSTDTPVLTIPMAASSVGNLNLTDLGVAFSLGIAWAVTTDDVAIPTTAGTSGDAHFTIPYK